MRWHHVIKRTKLHRVSCLGKTGCSFASCISSSLHRAATPFFLNSWSTYLTTRWWFTNNQSVGLFCVFFKTSALVIQIKSNPPQQVLTCLRKPAVNRKKKLRGLTSLIIPLAGLRNSLLDFFTWHVGQMQKGSAFYQLGVNYEVSWGVCSLNYPNGSRLREWQKL